MRIVAISGSLRAKSYNTALLRAAQKLAPDLNIEILDISALPVYNQDLEESDYPVAAKELREKIKAADGVLLAVPEFNRGVASSMKNFLDWSSRPEKEPMPWAKKPVGVLGASSGMRGANLAQFDVRRTLGYFNAYVMPQPEFYLANDEDGKFDAAMELTDVKTIEVLKRYLAAFTDHVASAQKA